jgi:hypothetical protein
MHKKFVRKPEGENSGNIGVDLREILQWISEGREGICGLYSSGSGYG